MPRRARSNGPPRYATTRYRRVVHYNNSRHRSEYLETNMMIGIDKLIARAGRQLLLAACLASAAPVFAQTAVGRAPNVSEPQGLNLGSTSFFDGFSGPPGWSYLGEVRYATAESIKNADGSANSAFRHPRVDSFTWVNHLAYASPWHLVGGTLGFNVIV